MSDLDSDDIQCRERSDLESMIPHYYLVDSTIDLTPLGRREDSVHDTMHRNRQTFNTTCFSADQVCKDRAKSTGDSNMSGPAPNTGVLVYYAPPIETEPSKGEEFLESLILTTPQINPRSWFPLHCASTIGRGRRIEVDGVKNSTAVLR